MIEKYKKICYTAFALAKVVFNNLKKLLPKQKRFQIAKSKKIIRLRERRNKQNRLHKRRPAKHKRSSANRNYQNNKIISKVIAPTILSLFDNPEDTLHFFAEVRNIIKKLTINNTLYFDLSKIEKVSVDAIMYLIATIKNTKKIKSLNIKCCGNVPANKDAQNIFETCGFYKYVIPKSNIDYDNNTDKIKITRGNIANPELAAEICDFVQTHNNSTRLDTKSLFTMIIELMTNTKQHAYNNNPYIESNWYVFAEEKEEHIDFVFLDTGEGIPNTIRTKGIIEFVKSKFDINDAVFVSSALRGEFRSETKLDYRGKGLPEIYNRVKNNYINDFSIISGFAKCSILPDGEIVEYNFSNEFIGTMLCWKINKKKVGNI